MKNRKIAKREIVREEIMNVLSTRLKIESLEELYRLVLKRLRTKNKSYVLSSTRVKNIVLQMPEVEMKVKTKKTPKLQKIERCPVCEGKIEDVKIKNLLNKTIVIGYRCVNCGYRSNLEAFMPMKYIFILKHK